MLTDGRTDGRTHGRTDGRTDDGRKVITIAHPEQSSGELKIECRLLQILLDILRVKYSGSLFVLRFYGPVNPLGSCRARSVYLTTRLLGRLSPLSG